MLEVVRVESSEDARVRELMSEYVAWDRANTQQLGLDLEAFDQHYYASHESLQFDGPDGCMLVATWSGAPAGMGGFRRLGPETCELKRLYVRPEFRGKFIARELLTTLIAEAARAGYRTMRLETARFMEQAQDLYARFGFRWCEPYYEVPESFRPFTIFMERELDATPIAPLGRDDAYRFIQACTQSRSMAEAMLDANPALLEARTGLGETPLHYLAVEDDLDAVRWLASRGAAIDSRNRFGDTPLMDAASLGYEAVVRFLVEQGADPNAETDNGEPALCGAARNNYPKVVELLLDAGARIVATDDIEDTALHWAAWEGHAEVAELLLKRGAPIEAQALFGFTPLHMAADHAHESVVDVLLAHGADRAARDDEGRTPADLARKSGMAELADRLEPR